MEAQHVTAADVDPLYGPATRGWWYIGLRLDATSYAPEQHDYDMVLLGDEESRTGQRDAVLAMPSGLPLWIGKGGGMAYPSLMSGMAGDEAVYVLAGVDPARLRERLPIRVLAVDRKLGGDQVLEEGVITAGEFASWK